MDTDGIFVGDCCFPKSAYGRTYPSPMVYGLWLLRDTTRVCVCACACGWVWVYMCIYIGNVTKKFLYFSIHWPVAQIDGQNQGGKCSGINRIAKTGISGINLVENLAFLTNVNFLEPRPQHN
jgi:hypothetical protein